MTCVKFKYVLVLLLYHPSFFLSFFLFIALVSMHFASDVLFELKHIIYEKMQIELSNYQIENWSHTYLMIYYTFANSIDIGDLVVINDLN